MRVYKDERSRWCIERDSGEIITLDWNESSMLYVQMRRDVAWEDVAMRFGDHPQWDEIENAKEDILDALIYEEEDSAVEDAVYSAVETYVDLQEADA